MGCQAVSECPVVRTTRVTYKLRLFQHVRDELRHDVVVAVEDARNLIYDPFLDHRHVDLLHVHLAVELGRELGRA